MPKLNKHMLHNYKPYDLFKMYNKYEKSFIFSKDQKYKFYYWVYRYVNQGKLLYQKIESQKSYDMYIFIYNRKENKMIVNINKWVHFK